MSRAGKKFHFVFDENVEKNDQEEIMKSKGKSNFEKNECKFCHFLKMPMGHPLPIEGLRQCKVDL